MDQLLWLNAHGDKSPMAALTRFDKLGKMRVDGNDAWLYYGEIYCHSDVGLSGKGYESVYGIVRSRRFASETPTDKKLFVPDPRIW